MRTDQAAEQEERARLEAARYLRRNLLQFARDERFAEAFAQALPFYWDGLYDIENAEEMSQNEALRFFDWFVFDYVLPDGRRPIEVYYQEKRADLASQQQAILDSWLNVSPAGAYELTGYEGQTLYLRDFVSGETYEAHEPGGRGNVEIGDVILARLVPLHDRLEFSTTAAYLPAAEIADLADELATAKAADEETYPHATHAEFMRRHNYRLIHHALAQAKVKGRPPVARLDPHRPDKKTQKIARGVKTHLSKSPHITEHKPQQTEVRRKTG
jgi:hypothetical protein